MTATDTETLTRAEPRSDEALLSVSNIEVILSLIHI